MTYNDNIEDPNYSINSPYNFFVGGDYARVIILLYILFSFLLNLLIIIAIIISKKKLSFISKITLSILGVNFIHTFSYIYEWVIKIEGKTKKVGKESDNTSVGFLLTGNPNNMDACLTQAFSLISSSISQDFLINIFVYLINQSNIPKISYICLAVFSLAFLFPCLLTLILLLVGALGINDRFCYVNKYKYDKNSPNIYEFYSGFEACVTIVYIVRTINLIYSSYIFIKIVKYVISRNLKITYIFKIASLLLIQLITISIGVIYRISSYFSKKFSVNFSGVYLILNTIDGVLFPLCFIISNGMHIMLYNYFSGKNINEGDEEDEEEQYPKIDDTDTTKDNNNINDNTPIEKSIPMTDLTPSSISEVGIGIGSIND